MGYRLIGYGALTVHFAFLAYVLVGGYLAWRWPRTIVAHLLAIGWAALSITVTLPCPLTGLQNWGRAHDGQPVLTSGFIDTYVRGTLYPANHERASQLVIGLVVMVSWIGYGYLLRRRRGEIRCRTSPGVSAEVQR